MSVPPTLTVTFEPERSGRPWLVLLRQGATTMESRCVSEDQALRAVARLVARLRPALVTREVSGG